MSENKDYFYGQTEPIAPPIDYRPWWLDVLIGIGCMLSVFAIIGGLSGCTTTRDAEVCYVKMMGQTEQGVAVVFQQCVTPEAFQESQK